MRSLSLVLLGLLLLPAAAAADRGSEVCVFRSDRGEVKQVDSIRKVPRELREQAQCFAMEAPSEKGRASRSAPSGKTTRGAAGGDQMASPDQVALEGNIREEDIGTPIGRIKLRWPRSAETLFGRTPLRAMTDAARTVSKAIRANSFPNYIQDMNMEWQVVFMDADLPETQIPAYLRTNCHPGWMTPPANIYIVADRIAGGCSGSHSTASVADSQLTEVLVHELGHAVEYFMLKYSAEHDRMRAEGFATWFEIYAANYSSVLNRSELQRRTYDSARRAVRRDPNSFTFTGSGEDYARASMFFSAIEDRQGVNGVVQVYQSMVNNRLDFFGAVQKELLWDKSKLNDEVIKLLK